MSDSDKEALYMILERNGRKELDEVLATFRWLHQNSLDLDKDLHEYLYQQRGW